MPVNSYPSINTFHSENILISAIVKENPTLTPQRHTHTIQNEPTLKETDFKKHIRSKVIKNIADEIPTEWMYHQQF